VILERKMNMKKHVKLILVFALFFLVASSDAIIAQNKVDEKTKKLIIEKIEKILDRSLHRIRNEIRDIIKQEIDKAISENNQQKTIKKRPFLGIVKNELTDKERKKVGIAKGVGLKIGSIIKDSPAEKANLKPGDIIIKIGDKEIREDNMDVIMKKVKSGEEIEVKFLRKKKEHTVKLIIGETERE